MIIDWIIYFLVIVCMYSTVLKYNCVHRIVKIEIGNFNLKFSLVILKLYMIYSTFLSKVMMMDTHCLFVKQNLKYRHIDFLPEV